MRMYGIHIPAFLKLLTNCCGEINVTRVAFVPRVDPSARLNILIIFLVHFDSGQRWETQQGPNNVHVGYEDRTRVTTHLSQTRLFFAQILQDLLEL
jgi:hypothetical protein